MSALSSTLEPPGRRSVNPWLVLTLVCLAQFMVILDATIVNVALPTLQDDLHFSSSSLQWVVNASTLVFGGFLLLGGRAADHFGRRRLFLAGVVLFTAASLLDGLATGSGTLIAARALQGLGAALVSPAALSIVTTTFEEGKPRTRAMGIWAANAVGGGAVGMLLGGILTEYASWRWILFVNVPVGIVTFLLAGRYVPESTAALRHRSFDLAGSITVTAGLVTLVYAIVKTQDYGWTSGRTLGLLALAAVLLAAFAVIEQRTREPLVRLSIFATRSLAVANSAMLVVAGGMFAIFFFATLYVQQILGLSPVEAGLGFIPLTAGIVLASGLAQALIPQVGVRRVALAGTAIAAVGLLLFARVSVDGSYLSDVLPPLLVMAVGLGLTFVPLTLIATTNVAAEDAGLSSGLFNTAQQVGGALGLAILSTLAATRTSDSLDGIAGAPSAHQQAGALVDGFQAAFLGGAALVALGFVLLAAFIRRRDVEAIDQADGYQPAETPATLSVVAPVEDAA
jgi:EmrB/QacA subfamily drug resistance transporter